MFSAPQQTKILTVTKLNRFAKQVLESELGQVWVAGEISNFVNAASGHWYFTLKDDRAQVRTAMFKGANRSVSFTPKHGDKVIVRANISLYEARGDYQLIAQSMEPEGVGQLKQAFEALKERLNQQGLFAQQHKKHMPEQINTVGIVTSSTGAALHDILHVLQRRNPSISVVIYPSLVQGELAADSICKQIAIANQRDEVDVLIVGRGGGSLEDLWPFNEESVAQAIFSSNLPIVSAVGHEVDVTIADFVADVRAATPSAAAELLSSDSNERSSHLQQLKRRLLGGVTQLMQHRLMQQRQLTTRLDVQSPNKLVQKHAQAVDYLEARLLQQHPYKVLASKQDNWAYLQARLLAQNPISNVLQASANVKEAAIRLTRSMQHRLSRTSTQIENNQQALLYLSPISKIEDWQSKVEKCDATLTNGIRALLVNKSGSLANAASLLDNLSPLATMRRGYSITYNEQSILRSVNDIKVKQKLRTVFADGEIESEVLSSTQSNETPSSGS